MDWQKTYSKIKYDLERNYSKYKDADTVEERQGYIQNYIKSINYMQNILNSNCPSFYKGPF